MGCQNSWRCCPLFSWRKRQLLATPRSRRSSNSVSTSSPVTRTLRRDLPLHMSHSDAHTIVTDNSNLFPTEIIIFSNIMLDSRSGLNIVLYWNNEYGLSTAANSNPITQWNSVFTFWVAPWPSLMCHRLFLLPHIWLTCIQVQAIAKFSPSSSHSGAYGRKPKRCKLFWASIDLDIKCNLNRVSNIVTT